MIQNKFVAAVGGIASAAIGLGAVFGVAHLAMRYEVVPGLFANRFLMLLAGYALGHIALRFLPLAYPKVFTLSFTLAYGLGWLLGLTLR